MRQVITLVVALMRTVGAKTSEFKITQGTTIGAFALTLLYSLTDLREVLRESLTWEIVVIATAMLVAIAWVQVEYIRSRSVIKVAEINHDIKRPSEKHDREPE